MTNYHFSDDLRREIPWLTRNLLRSHTSPIPAEELGISLRQTVSPTMIRTALLENYLSAHNRILTGRLSTQFDLNADYTDTLGLDSSPRDVLMSRTWAKQFNSWCNDLDLHNPVMTLTDADVFSDEQPLALTSYATPAPHHILPGPYARPDRPTHQPRVDLFRTNFTVDPLPYDELPETLLRHRDGILFFRHVPRRAELRLTHDMRHNVLVASWTRRDVRHDLGIRLPR